MSEQNQPTQEEIVNLIVEKAEREGGCVCFTFWELPLIPLRGESFPLKPHPRCPMHKHLVGEI